MPRISFQHRKTEVNLVPIIILSNVLDFAAQNTSNKVIQGKLSVANLQTRYTDDLSDGINYLSEASEYVSTLANVSEKISKGKESFDPIKELVAINLTKNTSIDSSRLYGVLKKLAEDLGNGRLNQSDIGLLRTITRTLKESTVKED
ncbi:MAG: hypothetical protein M1285_02540 [Candidatus Thermoplasmatota archaeon]|jgi:hypothetical protein|nr:hypothetical protein [Candidatus Thermoplasmatota archaeon]